MITLLPIAQIASTNPLERLNVEIKRRMDVVGIYPNEASIIRLVGALLLEQNDQWQLQRRNLPLDGLTAISDNQNNAYQPLSATETHPVEAIPRTPRPGTRS